MPRKSFWIGILFFAVLAIVLAACVPSYQIRGSLIDPPLPAPSVELLDSAGKPFSLNDQRGKIVLMFFGYTACPDVCPTTLADLKQTLAFLEEEEAAKIQVVFISLDPDRDTPEKAQFYASLFNPTFLGLSGPIETLEPIWDAYGVFREIDEETVTAAGYLVTHSARIYLIDQDGGLHVTYSYGTPPEDVAKDIQYLLK